MEETISIAEIFSILKKRISLIITMMFVGLGLSGVMTFFILTPKYSSQAQLIVTLPQNSNNNGNTINDVNTNLLMINTYRAMIKGDATLEKVQAALKSDYGYELTTEEIDKSLNVESDTNVLMFSIVAVTNDPQESAHIANVTATVFQSTAKDVLNESVDKISIISKATANLNQVSPNNKLNLAIGLVLGLMLGVGLSFLLELFDKTVKDESFIMETLGYTVLGAVPIMPDRLTPVVFKKRTDTYSSRDEEEEEPAAEQVVKKKVRPYERESVQYEDRSTGESRLANKTKMERTENISGAAPQAREKRQRGRV